MLVKKNFDDDGFPLSRNPNDLVFFSKASNFLSKNVIKDSQAVCSRIFRRYN